MQLAAAMATPAIGGGSPSKKNKLFKQSNSQSSISTTDSLDHVQIDDANPTDIGESVQPCTSKFTMQITEYILMTFSFSHLNSFKKKNHIHFEGGLFLYFTSDAIMNKRWKFEEVCDLLESQLATLPGDDVHAYICYILFHDLWFSLHTEL